MNSKRVRRTMFLRVFALAAALLQISVAKAADSFDSLVAEIQAANSGSGEITLSRGIILTGPLPPITGGVTIDGNGHSLSGDGHFRIFDVAGGTLVVNNLTLTGGHAERGGAIRLRNGAQATIKDSTLSENSATNGGAIATSSSSDRLTVSDSSFLNNKAGKNAAAIYANGGTIEISSSVFEKNCAQVAAHIVEESLSRAKREQFVDGDGCLHVTYTWPRPEDMNVDTEGYGGAIRLLNRARASIETSTFSKNKTVYGGAIAIEGPGATLTVGGGNFDGNFAKHEGGAIYADGGATDIRRSSFLDNYSDTSGGALFGKAGELNIANSSFHYNRASSWGGVLTASGADVTITHATMVNNAATHSGGDAIKTVEGSVKLRNSIIADLGTTDDCAGGLAQMVGNLSTDGTCALLASDDPLLGQPTGSPARYPWYPLKDFSPAVDAADPDYCLEIDQVGAARPHGGGCDIGAIESRTALPKPPPIEPPPPCPLALQIIAANTDAPAGGCPAGSGHDIIILSADITLDQKLPAITSDITIEGKGHTISGGGRFRIFSVDAGKLTINGLRLTEGKATSSINDSGGALRLQGNARVIVNDSIFSSNLGTHGGAIGVEAGAPALTVNGSEFVSNRASHGGGAIFSNGHGSIAIKNSSFGKNAANASFGLGGAIYGQIADAIDVSNSTFIGNIANRGGAVGARWASVTLTHVTMVDNAAFGSGVYREKDSRGAFHLRNSLIVGRPKVAHCYGRLIESVGNFIADGSCSSKFSGDPMIEQTPDDSIPAYLELLPDSPAIDAADSRYCARTDQLGRERPRFSLCDIGAIESIPVSTAVSDCLVTTTHSLNFREKPGGTRFSKVPENSAVIATARTPGWFQVEYRGASGWISADYVIMQGECE